MDFVFLLVHIRIHNKWMASKKKLMHKKILLETVQVWQKMKGRKPFYRNPYTMHKIVFTMVIIAKNAISFRINCVFYVFGHNPTSSTDLFFFSFFIWLLESIKRTRKMSYFFFFQSQFSFSDTLYFNWVKLRYTWRKFPINLILSLNLKLLSLFLLFLFHFLTQKSNFFVTQNGLYSA